MLKLILLTLLFTFTALAQPSGTVIDGPGSPRSFRPESSPEDGVIKTYFESAGPLAIEFFEHITLLSNSWLGGRQPGTQGSEIAGQYIAWNLERSGLTPAFDKNTSWYQPFLFDVDGTPPVVIKAFVAIEDMALVDERDFVVLGNSGSGDIQAPITFVGYAIEEGDHGYSSFDEETDLTGQIALMLRYEPLDEEGASQWSNRRFGPHSNIKDKMKAVVDRGAVGVILVNPPNCRDGRKGLENNRSSRFGKTNIPIVHFTEDAANIALGSETTIADLQIRADAGAITTQLLNQRASLLTEVESTDLHAQNIAGFLQGKGDLVEEWLVIGSHYDHVGYGYTGTSSPGVLHRGADDNASGTSANLILARLFSDYYSISEENSLRSVLFIFFDGEEAGLRGSAYFVKEPTMELDSINAMINLDMVGSLRDSTISISGSGTAVEFDVFIPEIVESTNLTASLTPSGTGASDHTNFYAKDIPVLFFFTGMTSEYHTPDDQAFTTNPSGGAIVTELAYDFAIRLIKDEKLTFSPNTIGGADRSIRMATPVRLGVHPSYSEILETGILLTGVSEDTSASDAGLQAEDVLLAWNDIELTGGRKLMELLKESTPGDIVELTVQRDGENIMVSVTLRAP
jgi:aminopeptidase YwaD